MLNLMLVPTHHGSHLQFWKYADSHLLHQLDDQCEAFLVGVSRWMDRASEGRFTDWAGSIIATLLFLLIENDGIYSDETSAYLGDF